jgi:hypothetical protein
MDISFRRKSRASVRGGYFFPWQIQGFRQGWIFLSVANPGIPRQEWILLSGETRGSFGMNDYILI